MLSCVCTKAPVRLFIYLISCDKVIPLLLAEQFLIIACSLRLSLRVAFKTRGTIRTVWYSCSRERCQISYLSLSNSLLTLIFIHPHSFFSHRCFSTHALTTPRETKAAAASTLHLACDYPRCLPTWYLPRTRTHLPSLIQICLHSKEIQCTFESSKETVVTLAAGRPQ